MGIKLDFFTILYLSMGAIVVLTLVILIWQRQAWAQAWRSLAEQTGLEFQGKATVPWSPLSVSGTYRGRSLSLDVVQHGSQKNRQNFTRVVVTARSGLIPQMEMKPEGVFEFFGKMVGWQDIEIGVEEIDKKYTITGQPVAEVLKTLSSLELRQRLLELPSVRLSIRGQSVACEKPGIQKDTDKLLQLFDLTTNLAEQAERAGGPAGQV